MDAGEYRAGAAAHGDVVERNARLPVEHYSVHIGLSVDRKADRSRQDGQHGDPQEQQRTGNAEMKGLRDGGEKFSQIAPEAGPVCNGQQYQQNGQRYGHGTGGGIE